MIRKSTITKAWEFGALAVMAYAFSLAAARMVPPAQQAGRNAGPALPMRAAQQSGKTPRDFGNILSRNIFGLATPQRSAQQDLSALPVSSLNIRLLGTIYAGDPKLRRAIIMLQNKKQVVKSVGERVENSTIKDIRRRGVVLEQAGTPQLLLMERNDAAIAEQSGHTGRHTMFSAGAMARGLRLTRTPEHDGVLVQRLDKTNPLAQLGLRAGDILTGIGETALTEPPTVQRLAALLNRKNVRIFLVRDNKPHIVHASLQR
ncbi:type II secretion system protein N [Pseudodesulfovibrio senegalensis]|uniref:Type II secretion system protein GspC N-terminal domain-containing protein n=1 Tax=Pseudodesulfovibrio senegalensis TaxID=1721087 RepID=A0A6N6N1L9_9BACT|nr:type II secretion system protein N [Pseudodesulfovibrio senegalensis]KAB1441420.1 hypothetical protein F8A88_10770 [Pseudodesulfovibrio senegalensis]